MAGTAIDTSVLIAGVLEWHVDHAACRAERERWERATRKPLIPVHALLECYSVITRLPAGHRLRADDASNLLRAAYGKWPIAALPSDGWAFIESLARRATVGGAVYDAVILESAIAAGATQFVTLDRADFERFGRDAIEIRLPGPPSG